MKARFAAFATAVFLSAVSLWDSGDQPRLAGEKASPRLHWHYERMPEEKHSTIYHPAALKAFRAVLGAHGL
ncbi:MAG: hypothetical protein ACJ76N_01230 [Thermoanaerobaculia bacterium]